ncbi:MAG: hypothetical protein GDA39_02525 [Hyphomonadaceae bacterium]|nr:hypothetical protein [Hyphomonadaceae bacterium]MBC6411843.1 hypothetical protein [Hyphomonadaceae bacterium]
MKKLLCLAACLSGLAGNAGAKGGNWICADSGLFADEEPLIQIEDHQSFSIVKVLVDPPIEHRADFYTAGLNRGWTFDDDYQITMKPDNTAAYYDFSGARPNEKRSPEMLLECKPEPSNNQEHGQDG